MDREQVRNGNAAHLFYEPMPRDFIFRADEPEIMSDGGDKALADMISVEWMKLARNCYFAGEVPWKFCCLEDSDLASLASKHGGGIGSCWTCSDDQDIDVLGRG